MASLMGVGWSPRLSTIMTAVLSGKRSAPVDIRYLKRPHATPRKTWSEVSSYLTELYWSVAETMPMTRVDFEAESDDEHSSCHIRKSVLGIGPDGGIDETSVLEQRFLPPGSIFQEWRQYCATRQRCSFTLFWRVWNTEFHGRLAFRTGYMHTVCPVCVKHKMLLRHLAHDASATLKQRTLWDRHLSRQYQDRQEYWNIRGQSRLRTKAIAIICDGMDQAKFAWPRSAFMSSHDFDSFQRPRLHVLGTIVHGIMSVLTVSDADAHKGASTTCEVLANILTRLSANVRLADYHVHLQLDNTSSSNKNNTVLKFMAVQVACGRVGTFTAGFLRVGHTHEDSSLDTRVCIHWGMIAHATQRLYGVT